MTKNAVFAIALISAVCFGAESRTTTVRNDAVPDDG